MKIEFVKKIVVGFLIFLIALAFLKNSFAFEISVPERIPYEFKLPLIVPVSIHDANGVVKLCYETFATSNCQSFVCKGSCDINLEIRKNIVFSKYRLKAIFNGETIVKEFEVYLPEKPLVKLNRFTSRFINNEVFLSFFYEIRWMKHEKIDVKIFNGPNLIYSRKVFTNSPSYFLIHLPYYEVKYQQFFVYMFMNDELLYEKSFTINLPTVSEETFNITEILKKYILSITNKTQPTNQTSVVKNQTTINQTSLPSEKETKENETINISILLPHLSSKSINKFIKKFLEKSEKKIYFNQIKKGKRLPFYLIKKPLGYRLIVNSSADSSLNSFSPSKSSTYIGGMSLNFRKSIILKDVMDEEIIQFVNDVNEELNLSNGISSVTFKDLNTFEDESYEFSPELVVIQKPSDILSLIEAIKSLKNKTIQSYTIEYKADKKYVFDNLQEAIEFFNRKVKLPGVGKLHIIFDDYEILDYYFAYGLIAINTLKPLYLPNENVTLWMVVLNKYGHVMPRQKINLTITDPNNNTYFFNNDFEDEYKIYEINRTYKAYFIPKIAGEYKLHAETVVENIKLEVDSYFYVAENYSFDIIRNAPITIDPWRERFTNNFTIIVRDDLDPRLKHLVSYDLYDYLPANFFDVRSNADAVLRTQDNIILVWYNVSNSSNSSFFYIVNAPKITPYLFYIGKAKIVYRYFDPVSSMVKQDVFYENRSWMLAIDPAAHVCDYNSPCICGADCSGGNEPGDGTIDSCPDLNTDWEFINDIQVTDLNHTVFGTGDTVRICLSVDCDSSGRGDLVTLGYKVGNVAWQNSHVVQEWRCDSADVNTFCYNIILSDYEGVHNVRGKVVWQYGSRPYNTICDSGATYGDHDDINFTVYKTRPPYFDIWNITNGTHAGDGIIVIWGNTLKAYSHWDRPIREANCSINSTVIPVSDINGYWANHTINTSNQTLFPSLGKYTVNYIRVIEDWFGYSNTTSPSLDFYVYGVALVDEIVLEPYIAYPNDQINVSCHVSDENVNYNYSNYNVSFYLNGTFLVTLQTNSTGWVNYSFNAPATEGNYTVVCNITDNLPNYVYASGTNYEKSMLLQVKPLGVDINPPDINWFNATPTYFSAGDTVTIRTNVTDDVNISVVYVNITYPDKTSKLFTMNLISPDIYEYVFGDTSKSGVYKYHIEAYDNSSNKGWTSDKSFESVGIRGFLSIKSENNTYKLGETIKLAHYSTQSDINSSQISVYGDSGYLFFDFDDGWQGWNKSSNSFDSWEHGVPSEGCASGSCLATSLTGNYNRDEDGYAISPALDLTGRQNVQIRLWRTLEVENGVSGADRAYIEISADGSTWSTVFQDTTSPNDPFTLSAGYDTFGASQLDNQPAARIRVRIVGDGDPNTYTGWAIDNVNISFTPRQDASSDWHYYNPFGSDADKVGAIEVSINVTQYNASGSSTNENLLPDLEIEFYDGNNYVLSKYCNLDYSKSYPYECKLTIVNKTIINAWNSSSNRMIRVRGVNLDNGDYITWNNVKRTIYLPSEVGNYGLDLSTFLLLSLKNSSDEIVFKDEKKTFNPGIYDLGNELNFTLPWDFGLGSYTLYAALHDAVGNVLFTDDGIYLNDTYAIVIHSLKIVPILPINNSQHIEKVVFNISIDTTYYSASACWAELNTSQNITLTSSGGYYVATGYLNKGNYTVTYYCNDTDGYTVSYYPIYFEVLEDNPVIQFVPPTPANNSYLSHNYIEVNVSANDTNLNNITIYLYNSSGLVNNVTFVTTLSDEIAFYNFTSLADGTYYINATACDKIDNCNSTETRKIVLDVTSPTITFVSPTPVNDSYLTHNYIEVNVSTNDANLVNVTIYLYNESALIDNQSFTTSNVFYNYTSLGEGIYYINATSCDKAGNCNSTETRKITLDTQAPQIQFVAPTPANNSYLSHNYIEVNVSANDVNFANVTIYLYDSSSLISSQVFTTENAFYNFTSLSDGIFFINATACDKAGRCNSTETRKITLDTQAPQIQFVPPTPANDSLLSQDYIEVNVSASDVNFANITIYLYDGSGLVSNQTFTTPNAFYNFTSLADGIYYINATSCDKANNCNSTETRKITLEFSLPFVDFIPPTPQENSKVTLSDLTINTSVIDYSLDKVWIYINNSSYALSCTLKSEGNYFCEYVLSNPSDGKYEIYVCANNSLGTTYCTNRRQFYVIKDYIPKCNNCTQNSTDFKSYTKSELENLCNPVVNFYPYARIEWLNCVNVTYSDFDHGAHVDIHRVSVDVSALNPELNSTARIVFYNVSFKNPLILQDGKICSDCTLEAYYPGYNISFIVPHFSTYEVVENYYTFWLRSETITSNGLNAYALNSSGPGTSSSVYDSGQIYDGSGGSWVYWGIRVYVRNSTAQTELTSGSPVAVVYRDDKDTSAGLLSGTWTPPLTNLSANSSIVVEVYQEVDTDGSLGNEWNLAGTFTTQPLLGAVQLVNKTWTIYYYTERLELATGAPSGRWTEGRFYWGDSTYTSRIENLVLAYESINVSFVPPTPTNNSNLSQNYIPINVTAEGSQIFDTLKACIYNTTGLINCNSTSNRILFWNVTNLLDGIYYINATANDSVDNVFSTETRQILLDTTLPLIQFIAPTPANDSYLSQNYIEVNVSANDTNLVNITVYLYDSSGTLLDSQIKTATVSNELFFYNFTSLSDGIYYINATACDIAGNCNSTETRKITLDNVIPTIQFVSPTPVNDSYLNQNYIEVNVSANDTNLNNITIYLYNLSGLVNNVTFVATLSDEVAFYNFTSLTDGIYYINATACDKANHCNSTETRKITLDNVIPTIQFVPPTPANDSYLSQDYIEVNVSVNDVNFVNVTIYLYNDSGLVSNQTFTTPNAFYNFTSLGDGIYYINATSCDNANNCNSTETRKITLDTTLPEVLFVPPTPANGSYLGYNYIEVNVSVIDDNPNNVTIYLYNDSGLVSNQTFTTANAFYNFTSLVDGIYYINATACDSANNCNKSETRTLMIDTQDPTIQFVPPTPVDDSYLSQDYIPVNVTSYDANFNNLTIYLYNSTDLVSNQTFTTEDAFYNFTSLVDGIYYINATACDKAGKCNSTETRKITLDNVIPTIQFVSPTPANDSYLNQNYIEVNVSANDTNLNNITIYLYNSSGLVNNVTFVATLSDEIAFYNFTSLPDGIYYINATACDKANQCNNTETRKITLDTQAPQIQFVVPTPANNSYLSQDYIEANVSASDIYLQNTTLYLYNSTGLVKNITFSATSTNEIVFYNFTNLSDGVYYINATSCDKANNCNITETRTIILDTQVPQIQFVSPTPANDSYLSQNYIETNVSASDVNFANITIYLYNGSGLVSNQTFTTPNAFYNFTSLVDGIYYINATSCDKANNCNSTETRTIILDTQVPQIQFVSPTPVNDSYLSQEYIEVNVTVTDDNFANVTIYLYNTSGLVSNQTFTTPNAFYNFTSLVDGIYYINATSCDNANNCNSTETRKVTLDTQAPQVSLIPPTPQNNSWINTNSTLINVSINDVNFNNLTIYLYNTTGLIKNVTLSSNPGWFNFTNLTEGMYYINATAYDKAGNLGISETRNFSIDFTNPQISFIPPTPKDKYNIDGLKQDWVVINVSVFDQHIVKAWLNFSSTIYDLTTTNGNVSINISGLSLGSYQYYACAEDVANNTNCTETRTINFVDWLPKYDKFKGSPNTTDFASNFNETTIQNACGVVLEEFPYGKIVWNVCVNATKQDYDSNIDFYDFGKLMVNSSGLNPTHNASANITFYNITLLDPSVAVDGRKCDYCEELSYVANNYEVQVPHFSNYTVVENTSLKIWDDSESTVIYIFDNITFYANYTDAATGNTILGANCTIEYYNGSQYVSYQMQYNSTSKLYEYTTNFSDYGRVYYNITCKADGYLPLTLQDDAIITAYTWKYSDHFRRIPILIKSEYQNTLYEYQVLINISFQEGMRNNFTDLKFTQYNYDTGVEIEIPYYREDMSSGTWVRTWVQTNTLVYGTNLIYAYYNTTDLTDYSNISQTFSYSQPRTIGYIVSDRLLTTGYTMISLADNNEIQIGSSSYNLNFGGTASGTPSSIADVVKAKSLVNVEGAGTYDDIIVPVSWAGTEFIYAGFRDSNERFCMLSPWGNASVVLYNSGTSVWSGTVTKDGTCVTYNVGSGIAVRIISDIPILVAYYGTGGYDSWSFYPATTDAWYGIPTQYIYVGAGPNGASLTIWRSDQATSSSTSINPNDDYSLSGLGADGSAPAFKVSGNYPIGAIQEADSDATEATTFLPKIEFGTLFGSANPTEWVAIASDVPATCTIHYSGGTTSTTLSSSNSEVYKGCFGCGSDSTFSSTSWWMSCDAPVYAMYEEDIDSEETNLLSWKQMRQYVYPSPYVFDILPYENKTSEPPNVTILSPPDKSGYGSVGDPISVNLTFYVNGTDPDYTVRVYDNGNLIWENTSFPADTNKSIILTYNSSDEGDHQLSVVAQSNYFPIQNSDSITINLAFCEYNDSLWLLNKYDYRTPVCYYGGIQDSPFNLIVNLNDSLLPGFNWNSSNLEITSYVNNEELYVNYSILNWNETSKNATLVLRIPKINSSVTLLFYYNYSIPYVPIDHSQSLSDILYYLEITTATVSSSDSTVTFSRSYENPLIIAMPPSEADTDSGVIRISSINSNNVTLRFVEEPGADGVHGNENVFVFVFPTDGFFRFFNSNVTVMEVNRYSTSTLCVNEGTCNLDSVALNYAFSSTPVVLPQIQTANDLEYAYCTLQDVTASGFSTAIATASGDNTHPTETIGYVAVTTGYWTYNNTKMESTITPDTITGHDNGWTTINFQQTYSVAPYFVANLQTRDGSDGGTLRYTNLGTSSVQMHVDEDTVGDTEQSHTTEVAGMFVIEKSGLYPLEKITPFELSTIAGSSKLNWIPLTYKFNGSATTNFTALYDRDSIQNVTNITIENENGSITWHCYVNATRGKFDAFVNLSQGSLNVTFGDNLFVGLVKDFNCSATIRFYNISMSDPVVLADGKYCDFCNQSYDPSGKIVEFNVTHFAYFTLTENSSLDVWDDSDSKIVVVGQDDYIYANYTFTNGTALGNDTSLCRISFYNGTWTAWDNMSYNQSSQLWYYDFVPTDYQFRLANVSCNSSVALDRWETEPLRIVCDYAVTIQYSITKNSTTKIYNVNKCELIPSLFIDNSTYNLTSSSPLWNTTLTTYDGLIYKWNSSIEWFFEINTTIDVINYTIRREWFWFIE